MSDCADAQDDLSIRCAHLQSYRKCFAMAHYVIVIKLFRSGQIITSNLIILSDIRIISKGPI